jgi:hypothetical protein
MVAGLYTAAVTNIIIFSKKVIHPIIKEKNKKAHACNLG